MEWKDLDNEFFKIQREVWENMMAEMQIGNNGYRVKRNQLDVIGAQGQYHWSIKQINMQCCEECQEVNYGNS